MSCIKLAAAACLLALVGAEYPSGGGGGLSTSYGVPSGGGGDSYNQHEEHHEAKPYEFGYAVKDHHTGTDFGQQESSDGHNVKGQYRVLLPDGRVQIVTYTADWKTGFHADVKYEGEAQYPTNYGQGGYGGQGGSGGYSGGHGGYSGGQGGYSGGQGGYSGGQGGYSGGQEGYSGGQGGYSGGQGGYSGGQGGYSGGYSGEVSGHGGDSYSTLGAGEAAPGYSDHSGYGASGYSR